MSLRTRLTISYVSFFAVALLVLDIGLYMLVRQSLVRSIDNDIDRAAERLQQNFAYINRDARAYSFGDNEQVLFLRGPWIYEFTILNTPIQVYDQREVLRGNLKPQSSNVDEHMPVDPDLLRRALDGEVTRRYTMIGDVELREVLLPLRFRDNVVGAVQIARSMTETERALKVLMYALLGGSVVVLVTAARGGAWLTRAAFKPINEITETSQSIVGAEDLSRRVPVPAAQDELQRLTVTINAMLARLEQQFNTQRRFLADVSHELRTPLAAMHGNLEVLDRGAARDPQLLNESLADMRSEVSRLIRMVNDLLLLAQSEAGVKLRHELIELDTLLLEVHRELRPLANGVQIRIGHEDQLSTVGDRDRIKQALLNLAVNAIQHTPVGGRVTLEIEELQGRAAIRVIDTGCGIVPEDIPHIFERFFRADRARTRARGGAGLGLPIVKWIAEAHGGEIVVDSTPGVGSTFTLLLPLAPQPVAPPPPVVAEHA